MSDVDQPPKIVQVTSSRPAVGKTTVAISLAISAAPSGLNVALVDAELRHPAASRFFKLEKEVWLICSKIRSRLLLWRQLRKVLFVVSA
jgi:Mrp family chromosome partitioning ATPase